VTSSRCRIRVALWAFALLAAQVTIHAALAAGDARKSKQAVDRSLAIYVPQNELDAKIFISQLGAAVSPGKGLEQAALAAGALYFKSAAMISPQSDAPFNLVLVTHSHWEHKDGNSTLSVKYKLLDSAGKTLIEGEKHDDMNTVKLFETNGFLSLSFGIMKDILSDDELLAKAAAPATLATSTAAAGFDRRLLVNRDKAVQTGTGFFINDHGQVMTAAHVVHGCPLIELKADGKSAGASVSAESVLLDLAVVDTGSPSAHSIPLRAGTSFDLGEGVINIGFPLTGVLSGSPNVTRGNISSREALAGAVGQFQFSAPVQPGSSGGPVVSESGELLGVTVASLRVMGLLQRGVIPQNVNFALDARYAAKFLERNKIVFESVPAKRAPDVHSTTEATLPAVVQVSCYQ
jgi:S1-C subfamily serine protease